MIQAGLNEVQTEAMLFIFIIYKVATIYNGKLSIKFNYFYEPNKC